MSSGKIAEKAVEHQAEVESEIHVKEKSLEAQETKLSRKILPQQESRCLKR